MIRQLFSSICLVVAVIFIAAGCGQQRKKDVEILARGPDLEKLVIPGDYADAAIKATGGLQNWAKVTKIQLDCVVTFYQPDGAFYLTEHRFYIYPWSDSVEVFGKEALGTIAWQLSDEQFRTLPGDEKADLSAMRVSARDYAEAILKITTAPVQFLQAGVVFAKGPAPVKMEGLWYDPIEQVHSPQPAKTPAQVAKPYWSKVVYYQNSASSLVDLLWLADTEQGKFLAVRGYDYKPVTSEAEEDAQKKGVLLPTKIEIFRTDARAFSRERLVKIDLK